MSNSSVNIKSIYSSYSDSTCLDMATVKALSATAGNYIKSKIRAEKAALIKMAEEANAEIEEQKQNNKK